MSEKVTLDLPEELAEHARAVAARSRRGFEEVLVEWMGRAGEEAAVELLPDDQVLALCDAQLEAGQQEELSDLLARNREGSLQVSEHGRLDDLMRVYRRGLLRKARALKVAVSRGLRTRLE